MCRKSERRYKLTVTERRNSGREWITASRRPLICRAMAAKVARAAGLPDGAADKITGLVIRRRRGRILEAWATYSAGDGPVYPQTLYHKII